MTDQPDIPGQPDVDLTDEGLSELAASMPAIERTDDKVGEDPLDPEEVARTAGIPDQHGLDVQDDGTDPLGYDNGEAS